MRRMRLWPACWSVLLLIAAGACLADDVVTISDRSLQLTLELDTGSVRQWVAFDEEGERHDLAAFWAQSFALEGRLAGRTLADWRKAAGGWSVRQYAPDRVELVLEHPELPWAIVKRWQAAPAPWRVDFSIEFIPLAESEVDDEVWLSVGPGVGEEPAKGLGFAQSIYSYTEVVARDNAELLTLRLDTEAGALAARDASPEWIGLHSRYYALILARTSDAAAVAWRASADKSASEMYPSASADLMSSFGLRLPVNNGARVFAWRVFGGPKSSEALSAGAPDLRPLLFASLWEWMRSLSLGLMHVLRFLHNLVSSWGFAIILLALLVRVAVYPLARNAIAAQRRFAAIQEQIRPQMSEIRRNYSGEEQSERILQLYEGHGVSPLAGMKPLLIVLVQVPIFVALFHLLGDMYELRNESFLWMDSLAEPDKLIPLNTDLPFFGAYFNLLPVLMALSTLAAIKLAPAPASSAADARRQLVFLVLMAVGFFLLFYSFPAGMVLYWTMANVLQVAHQRMMSGKSSQ